jgi:hypothetical protein
VFKQMVLLLRGQRPRQPGEKGRGEPAFDRAAHFGPRRLLALHLHWQGNEQEAILSHQRRSKGGTEVAQLGRRDRG